MQNDTDQGTVSGRRAVALRYDKDRDSAPTVVATGKGHVAAQIVRIARENNVPLRSDPLLAEALASLDLDAQIPPELYRAVAEVLAFVYRMNQMSTLRPAARPNTPTSPNRR